MASRRCGQCDECCTLLAVGQIDKPADTRCPHLAKGFHGGGMCGIYDSQPSDCNKFVCGWLGGILPAKYRPDKIGIVVYFGDSEEGPYICVAETRTGAFDSEAGQEITAMARQHKKGRQLILSPYRGFAYVEQSPWLPFASEDVGGSPDSVQDEVRVP